MRIIRKFVLCFSVGLISLAATLPFGCQQSAQNEGEHPSRHLTVGIGTWAGFATGILGDARHLFDNIKVETRILDDNAARNAAFQSGDLDIMISSVDVFAQEAAIGVQGNAILITDESWGGDGIVSRNDIVSPSDLRGKTIAYARGTPSHYLLHKVLESAGLTISDVTHVQVDDPGRAGDVFLAGEADAAVTWEPFLSQVAESGKGKILTTTREHPDIVVDLLIASDSLSNDPELLRRFIDGWLKSVEFIKAHPDSAAVIMADGLNLPVENVRGMMAGLRYADRQRNAQFFNSAVPGETRLAELFDAAGAYWQSVGIIDQPIDAAGRVSVHACGYFNPR